ncbi:MAG: phosphofructokinase [Flavobacterium psychrophilum]|nr:MAG: phosphofructokinase [Flavobacterium psychrophilum]
MANILTITLNPAVDKSSTANHIQPEKKIRCSLPVYEPGGGGINVSRGLKRLGINAVTLFSKGGRTGELLEQLLNKEDVKILPVETSAETRENFIVVDTANNNQYRFGMPGEKLTTADADALQNAILNSSPFPDIAVISGSLPEGLSPKWLRKLFAALKAKNVKIIADTSGDALTEILNEGVYLIKPNIGELSRLSGKEELDNESADEAAKLLIDQGKTEIVAVSMGPQGAYLVTKDETIHVSAPSVKKLSTVGAGDSMVAGMVSVIARGGSLTEMARMGVACGTAATMSKGTGLFTKENAEKLYNWLSK